MWNRRDLKERAKMNLRGVFLIAGIAVLIAMFLGGQSYLEIGNRVREGEGIDPSISMGSMKYTFDTITDFGNLQEWLRLPFTLLAVLLGGAALVVGFLFSIFIGGPIDVGLRRFFLTISRHKDRTDLKILFSVFRDEHYMNIVKAKFITGLKIFLWFLLLIVPGIIKSIEYYFIPWILAENPEMDQMTAQGISSRMTMGHKGEMFVLFLSFIGWYIASGILLGIPEPWVRAYSDATFTELYETLGSEQSGTSIYGR